MTVSNGPLYVQLENEFTVPRTHSKIPFETHKILKKQVFKKLEQRVDGGFIIFISCQ